MENRAAPRDRNTSTLYINFKPGRRRKRRRASLGSTICPLVDNLAVTPYCLTVKVGKSKRSVCLYMNDNYEMVLLWQVIECGIRAYGSTKSIRFAVPFCPRNWYMITPPVGA